MYDMASEHAGTLIVPGFRSTTSAGLAPPEYSGAVWTEGTPPPKTLQVFGVQDEISGSTYREKGPV